MENHWKLDPKDVALNEQRCAELDIARHRPHGRLPREPGIIGW
jgi:hypothetical protein